MPVTQTAAIVRSVYFDIINGVAPALMIEFDGTDSNNQPFRGQWRHQLTPTQQTNFANFITALLPQADTDTNLTITLS